MSATSLDLSQIKTDVLSAASTFRALIGLGNVDNTSDANKPISSATQTALDAKLSLTGGTLTGGLTGTTANFSSSVSVGSLALPQIGGNWSEISFTAGGLPRAAIIHDPARVSIGIRNSNYSSSGEYTAYVDSSGNFRVRNATTYNSPATFTVSPTGAVTANGEIRGAGRITSGVAPGLGSGFYITSNGVDVGSIFCGDGALVIRGHEGNGIRYRSSSSHNFQNSDGTAQASIIALNGTFSGNVSIPVNGTAAAPALRVGTQVSGLTAGTNQLHFVVDGAVRAWADRNNLLNANAFNVNIPSGYFTINSEVFLYRNATGPSWEIRAAGGLLVKNAAGSADAALTCGEITNSIITFNDISGSHIRWSNGTRIYCGVNGNLALYNSSLTDFNRLQFGGTTSSFPALKRSGAALHARLADDSNFASMSCNHLTAVGGGTFSDRATFSNIMMVGQGGSHPSTGAYAINVYAGAPIAFSAAGGAWDVALFRNSTGPALDIWAAGGARIRNADGSAAGAIDCGALTATTGYFQAVSNQVLDLRNSSGSQVGYIQTANSHLTIRAASTTYPLRLYGNLTGIRIGDGTYTVDLKPVGSNSVIGFYTGQGDTPASGALADILCGAITSTGTSTLGSTNFTGQIRLQSANNTRLAQGGNDGDLQIYRNDASTPGQLLVGAITASGNITVNADAWFGLGPTGSRFIPRSSAARIYTSNSLVYESNANDTAITGTLSVNGSYFGLRRGTNATRFELYGTYTDASNYRRLYVSSTTAGAFTLGVEGAGTGASGNTLTIGNQLLFGDGSQSVPSISFSNRTNTGIYSSTNAINFSVNGTLRQQFQSDGSIAIFGTDPWIYHSNYAIRTSGAGIINFRAGNGTTPATVSLGTLNASALVNVGAYTFGTLPAAASNAGALAQITDSSVTTNGTIAAGGGSSRALVFSNGTDWIVVVA